MSGALQATQYSLGPVICLHSENTADNIIWYMILFDFHDHCNIFYLCHCLDIETSCIIIFPLRHN